MQGLSNCVEWCRLALCDSVISEMLHMGMSFLHCRCGGILQHACSRVTHMISECRVDLHHSMKRNSIAGLGHSSFIQTYPPNYLIMSSCLWTLWEMIAWKLEGFCMRSDIMRWCHAFFSASYSCCCWWMWCLLKYHITLSIYSSLAFWHCPSSRALLLALAACK